jgi:predicted Fe-Mo cluster-binding NifX family protein
VKVAIAVDGEHVSQHFGRCERYELAELVNGDPVRRHSVPNPGHAPGRVPLYLKEAGADCIVAGGMGRQAQVLFEQFGIEVIMGVSGSVEDAVAQLAAGKLRDGKSTCDH